jgi:hypothetical protein
MIRIKRRMRQLLRHWLHDYEKVKHERKERKERKERNA